MRSEMIFRAQEKVANRYRLCHAASKVSRCLHYYSATTQDAISDAFVRISHVPCLAQPISAVPSVQAHPFVEDTGDMLYGLETASIVLFRQVDGQPQQHIA